MAVDDPREKTCCLMVESCHLLGEKTSISAEQGLSKVIRLFGVVDRGIGERRFKAKPVIIELIFPRDSGRLDVIRTQREPNLNVNDFLGFVRIESDLEDYEAQAKEIEPLRQAPITAKLYLNYDELQSLASQLYRYENSSRPVNFFITMIGDSLPARELGITFFEDLNTTETKGYVVGDFKVG